MTVTNTACSLHSGPKLSPKYFENGERKEGEVGHTLGILETVKWDKTPTWTVDTWRGRTPISHSSSSGFTHCTVNTTPGKKYRKKIKVSARYPPSQRFHIRDYNFHHAHHSLMHWNHAAASAAEWFSACQLSVERWASWCLCIHFLSAWPRRQ